MQVSISVPMQVKMFRLGLHLGLIQQFMNLAGGLTMLWSAVMVARLWKMTVMLMLYWSHLESHG